MKRFIKNIIPDVLICVGIAMVGYGAYSIYKPAGYISWGVMLIMGAVILIRGGD